VGDDIDIHLLPDDVHGVELVRRDGTDDDAVVIVVERLHLSEVSLDLLVGRSGEVGEEDGVLDACAALAYQVLGDEATDLVALDGVRARRY